MKALLLADLYQVKINCKFYLVFVLVAAGIVVGSGVTDEGGIGIFMPVYAVMMSSMLGMSLMQLDEQSHWNVYAQALPCTRRDQVSSKYAVTLICFGCVWALFAVLFVALALLGRMAWQMAGLQTAFLAVLGLLAPAFSLPPMYRWGSNKGRVIFTTVIILLGFGIGALFSSLDFEKLSLPSLPVQVLIALAVLIPLALFAGSWALAVRWNEKREL